MEGAVWLELWFLELRCAASSSGLSRVHFLATKKLDRASQSRALRGTVKPLTFYCSRQSMCFSFLRSPLRLAEVGGNSSACGAALGSVCAVAALSHRRSLADKILNLRD